MNKCLTSWVSNCRKGWLRLMFEEASVRESFVYKFYEIYGIVSLKFNENALIPLLYVSFFFSEETNLVGLELLEEK
jgi:hypothetical protein